MSNLFLCVLLLFFIAAGSAFADCGSDCNDGYSIVMTADSPEIMASAAGDNEFCPGANFEPVIYLDPGGGVLTQGDNIFNYVKKNEVQANLIFSLCSGHAVKPNFHLLL